MRSRGSAKRASCNADRCWLPPLSTNSAPLHFADGIAIGLTTWDIREDDDDVLVSRTCCKLLHLQRAAWTEFGGEHNEVPSYGLAAFITPFSCGAAIPGSINVYFVWLTNWTNLQLRPQHDFILFALGGSLSLIIAFCCLLPAAEDNQPGCSAICQEKQKKNKFEFSCRVKPLPATEFNKK